MRLLVVGAGSTGGFFGAHLARAGRDVTFLVREQRARVLRERGLRIASPLGDFTVAPTLLVAGDVSAPFDAVMLAVKAYSLDSALDGLAPYVDSRTLIMPVLNGMRHLDVLAERFGAHSVIGCACKVATVVDDDGSIRQLNTMQELVYGELDGALTARIAALDATLRGAAFLARLSSEIELEMWEKWIMLATLGGVTCLMRGPIGEIVAAPGGTAFTLAFLDEVVAVVVAEGFTPRAPFLASLRARLTAGGSPWNSSMYRDLAQGQPVEADQILGDLIARASRRGVPTPLLSAAYAHLMVYSMGRERRG